MTDQLLLVSRIALLAFVYLVFMRVARAVIVEVRAETRAESGSDRPVRVPSAARAAGSGKSPSAASSVKSSSGVSQLSIVSAGSWSGAVYPLEVEATIGRAPGCAISIDDPRISKLHARVFLIDARWVIEDLGSTNGTAINGHLLHTPHRLAPGDRIHVGEVELEFS